MAKTDNAETLKDEYRKGALALNKIAAKLKMEYNDEPPDVPKYKPFKHSKEQLDSIKMRLKGKTVNNTGWTTILGYCGITGAAPVLAAREALEAAEVIDVEEVAGIGRNTGKKICLHGEDMGDKIDVIA